MEAYERLEQEWAKFNDLDPAGMVACATGTAALHLALEALRLPQESEVIVPDFGMIACPRAVTMAGLVPVFVDCGDDLLLSWYQVGQVITGRARAVMPVHIYGRTCPIPAKSGRLYGLAIIEDLAEAHGVRPHPDTDAACWSFFRNKIVAGAEGGAVWFRDPAHARLARSLRCLGFTDAHDYRHHPRGWNHRLSNAHAELILDSLQRYPGNLIARRVAEECYDAICPDEWRMPPRDAPWVYDLRLRGVLPGMLDVVVNALRAAGVEARHGFKPMHQQEEYLDCRRVGGHNAALASQEVLYLPLQPGVVTADSARLAFDTIRRVLPGEVGFE